MIFPQCGRERCELQTETIYCNMDKGIVSLRHSIDTIVITDKSTSHTPPAYSERKPARTVHKLQKFFRSEK